MLANCKKVFLTTPLESQRMTYERYWEINHPHSMYPQASLLLLVILRRTEEEEVCSCDRFFCRKTSRAL